MIAASSLRGFAISIVALACLGGIGIFWLGEREPGPAATQDAPADSAESQSLLDAAQREYLWEVEHHVLVLSKYWLKDLALAIVNEDAAALQGALAADFRFQAINDPLVEKLSQHFVMLERRKPRPGAKAVDQPRSAWTELLLHHRKMFAGRPHVKIYPKTLAPEARDDLNSAWSGAGVLRMWGESEPGKPAEVVLRFQWRMQRPEKSARQGWLQLIALEQSQIARAPRFFFADVTRARGVDPDLFHDNWRHEKKVGGSGGVYVCDFDRDGILDMLVTDNRRIALFRGLPDARFEDVTSAMGIPSDAPDGTYAAFVDLDGDGWEDLVLANRVYRNEQGKRFLEYTNRTNLRIMSGITGVIVADFNRDGLMDLYVTRPGKGKEDSWLDGKSGETQGNVLWQNLGNWKFKDVTRASGAEGGFRSVFSAVCFDANNDGWPDLYVPNEFGNGVLLLNQKDGTFLERSLTSGPGDFGTMGITCGDIDGDGNIDLYLANMYSKTGSRIIGNLRQDSYPDELMTKMRRFVSGSEMYLNRGEKDGRLSFQPVAHAWQVNDVGWAYGPALADLDNDGFLDIFATSGYMSFSRDEPDG